MYVYDVAKMLLRLGHAPVAYSPALGEVGEWLRAATVPVIDDLDRLSLPPDVIHGQHTLETLAALLRFPRAPAVYFCHGWKGWNLAPLRFPRVFRFVAVDETCRDRLLYEHGIPVDRTHLLLNFVDLQRFTPRSPLPERPRSALAFGNDLRHSDLSVLETACARRAISLRTIGRNIGGHTPFPERILRDFDLVFAKGRCALEAMAAGAAVILLGAHGLGPLVTAKDFDGLRRRNFGVRTLERLIEAKLILRQIDRYDANDARVVSARVRREADKDAAVDEIVKLYRLAIQDHAHSASDPNQEASQAAAFLRGIAPLLYGTRQAQREAQGLRREVERLTAERDSTRGKLTGLRRSRAVRCAAALRRCLRWPSGGRRAA
jgi:hypothetical protein